MGANFQLARERLGVITAIIGEVVGSTLALFFYFTFFVPFALIARISTDPLHRRSHAETEWLQREPIPSELEKAQKQG